MEGYGAETYRDPGSGKSLNQNMSIEYVGDVGRGPVAQLG